MTIKAESAIDRRWWNAGLLAGAAHGLLKGGLRWIKVDYGGRGWTVLGGGFGGI